MLTFGSGVARMFFAVIVMFVPSVVVFVEVVIRMIWNLHCERHVPGFWHIAPSLQDSLVAQVTMVHCALQHASPDAHCMSVGQLLHVSPGSWFPFPQVCGQSLSV